MEFIALSNNNEKNYTNCSNPLLTICNTHAIYRWDVFVAIPI